MQRVMHSVLTARILLNLRQAVRLEAKLSSQSILSWEPNASTNADSTNHCKQERTEGGEGASSSLAQGRNTTRSKINRTGNARPSSIPSYQWNVTGTGTGNGSGSNSSQFTGSTSIMSSGGSVGRHLSAVLDLDEENWAHDEECARCIEDENPELFIETTALSLLSGTEGILGGGGGEGPNGSGSGSGSQTTEADVQIV